MKRCSKCSKMLPRDKFYADKRAKDGLTSACKDCNRKSGRESYARNPAKRIAETKAYQQREPEKWKAYKAEYHIDHMRDALRYKLSQYGITVEQYEEILAQQDYVCAICKSEPSGERLHVDHCHSTGRVRGLLCKQCNTGLGFFKDNTTSLEQAVKYLIDSRK